MISFKPPESIFVHIYSALGFAIIASMLIGCLFLPTGFIHKPTPYLWKAIGGISFFYLSVLIYFLYLVIYSNYLGQNLCIAHP